MKHLGRTYRIIAAVLCVCAVLTLTSGMTPGGAFRSAGGDPPTSGGGTISSSVDGIAGKAADGSTMFSFQKYLDLEKESRYAGRLWSDKTVLTEGVNLDRELKAGESTTFGNEADFLHVFSLLGSSQQLEAESLRPLDAVFLLDMSGSMASDIEHHAAGTNSYTHTPNDKDSRIKDSRIYKVLQSINAAIDQVMKIKGSRVAVVGYGATAAEILPLGSYEAKQTENDIGQYLTVDNFAAYDENKAFGSNNGTPDWRYVGSGAYTVIADVNEITELADGTIDKNSVTIKVRNNYNYNGESDTNATLIGFHTDMQAGIWVGFNELFENMKSEEDVTYTYTSDFTGVERTVARVPVAFVMTDGGSNYALKSETGGVTGDEWHALTIPENASKGYTTSYEKYRAEHDWGDNSVTPKYGGGDAVILDILLTASYMKTKVEKTYEHFLPDELQNETTRFYVRTISVDTPDTIWQVPRVYATLDPKTHFRAEGGDASAVKDANWTQTQDIKDAYRRLQDLKSNGTVELTFRDSDQTINGKSNRTIPFKKLADSGENITVDGVNIGTITNDEVFAEKSINYSDGFDDINTSDLTVIFRQLIEEYGGTTFDPVHGTNDLGVQDAVTYMDPMGKYMEVKDVDSLVLFGERHGLVKAGVYSYEFNRRADIRDDGVVDGDFIRGWYNTITGEHEPSTTDSDNGKYYPMPTKYDTAEDARKDHWEFYFDRTTAQQFVPTLDLPSGDSLGNITDKQRNTTYTFYRFAQDKIGSESEDVHDMHNPCYGYVQDGETRKWNQHFNLTDIRVWVEDTGSYNDDLTESGSVLTDAGYDQALWISIPSEAVPLRTVTIGQQLKEEGGEASEDYTYTTNVVPVGTENYEEAEEKQEYQDLPLRLFYSVGVSDDIKSNGRVDLSKVSQTYLESHTVHLTDEQRGQVGDLKINMEDGDVWFNSNWYSGRLYTGYVIDSEKDKGLTYGEPLVSFSPSADNRYYLFEKPLVLYDFSNDKYEGQEFMENGRPAEFDADPTYETGGEMLTFTHEGHTHSYPRVSSAAGLQSDKWYYIAVEYYKPVVEDGVIKAKKVYHAVGRLGREFGSGVGVEQPAAYLCWYDPATKQTQPYVAGAPAGGGGKPAGDNWFVAARPGGLRVGAMSQNVRAKKGGYDHNADLDKYPGYQTYDPDGGSANNTGTSETYYLPTVSTSVSTGEGGGTEGGGGTGGTEGGGTTDSDVVINAYLGNNGVLWTSDTHLLVTKTVDRAGDINASTQDDRVFNYRIQFSGKEPSDVPVLANVNAIVVTQMDNGTDNIGWRRRFSYIDLPISNQGLLQDDEYQPVTVDINGTPKADGEYYLYIGDNETEGETGDSYTFRLYNNRELTNYPPITKEDVIAQSEQDGTVVRYQLAKAWVVDKGFTAPEGLPALDSLTDVTSIKDQVKTSIKDPIEGPVVCTLDLRPDKKVPLTMQDTDIKATGERVYGGNTGVQYPIEVGYATRALEFVDGVATFTLKSGEGLLFIGLDSGTPFTVTELLTAQDVADGYTLQYADHVREGRFIRYEENDQLTEGNTARLYTYYCDLTQKDGTWTGSDLHDKNCTELPADGVTAPSPDNPDAWYQSKETAKDPNPWLRHYFRLNGVNYGTFTGEITSSSAVFKDQEAGGASYAISGSTDSFEQRIHFYNAAPIINKTETDPGEYVGVAVGDPVHYDITWYNDAHDETAAVPAHVTIYDPLDDGVDFTSALLDASKIFWPNGGDGVKDDRVYTLDISEEAGKDGIMHWGEYGEEKQQLLIAYTGRNGENRDAIAAEMLKCGFPVSVAPEATDTEKLTALKAGLKDHTVVWSIHRAAAGAAGVVGLNVTVNERAETYWNGYQNQSTSEVDKDYDPFDNKQTTDRGGKNQPPEPNDYQILNRAGVRVENGGAQFTEVIENPVNKPRKNEVHIAPAEVEETEWDKATDTVDEALVSDGVWEGPEVDKDDTITYRVTWKNFNQDDPATPKTEGFANVQVIDKLDPGVNFDETTRADYKYEYPDSSNPAVEVKGVLQDATAYRLVTTEVPADNPNGYLKIGEDKNARYYEEIPVKLSEMVDQVISDPGTDPGTDPGDDPDTEWVEKKLDTPVAAAEYNKDAHTLKWDLGAQQPEAEGFVQFTVTVNENARRTWNYGTGENGADTNDFGEGDDDIIHNQASVTVTNAAKVVTGTTDRIDNPLWTPEKTETKINTQDVTVVPGGDGVLYGQQVGVGDDVSYRITWRNYHRDTDTVPGYVENGVTNITVRDALDPGLAYDTKTPTATAWIKCTVDEHEGHAEPEYKQVDGVWYHNMSKDGVYDDATHTLTWTLENVQPQAEGFVEFTVTVTADALKKAEYDENAEMKPGEGADYRVQNQATVTVGNDSMVTEKMENPISGKTETDPGDGLGVVVGQQVEYEIGWHNTAAETDNGGTPEDTRDDELVFKRADVIIEDQLDPGVDFLSASFGGVELKAQVDGDGNIINGTVQSEDKNSKDEPLITIAYDAADRMVTWTLKDRDPNEAGEVELSVTVNEKAFSTWDYPDMSADDGSGRLDPDKYGDGTLDETTTDDIIYDQAKVTIDNVPKVTNKVENPLREPEKIEVTPGEGTMVQVGDEITFQVTWENTKNVPANITIRDPLDVGVDYVVDSAKAYIVDNDKGGEVKGAPVDALKHDVGEDLKFSPMADSYEWLEEDGTKTPGVSSAVRPTEEDGRVTELNWKFGSQPAGARGYVEFTVTVNKNAEELWSPDDPTGAGDKGHRVYNQAGVTVGNIPELKTNTVENPVPEKEETVPGAGEGVYVGQKVDYSIYWFNDGKDPVTGEFQAAKVTITDVLDPGVDFASASFGGVTLEAQRDTEGNIIDGKAVSVDGNVTITYNATAHSVIWTLENRPAYGAEGSEGDVSLSVTVNKNAFDGWKYEEPAVDDKFVPVDPGKDPDETPDDVIHNRAKVSVENGSTKRTEIVDNPVWKPEKTETDPGDGVLVQVGKEVTYQVTWKNYHTTAANVVVTDVLDPGVDYNDGTALAYIQIDVDDSGEPIYERMAVAGVYDDTTHTITWTLPDQPAQAEGFVEFTVTVNKDAFDGWAYPEDESSPTYGQGAPTGALDYKIVNQASVKVGEDPDQYTEIPENPLEDKREVTPGENVEVAVGQQITYEIRWVNDAVKRDQNGDIELDANGNTIPVDAVVTITDKLDPGVDFTAAWVNGLTLGDDSAIDGVATAAVVNAASATIGGIKLHIEYDPETHMVTWTLDEAPAGDSGVVKLVVTVNELAKKDWQYGTGAGDADTNEVDPNKDDFLVHNRARIQVENGSDTTTHIVDNPLWEPKKTEFKGEELTDHNGRAVAIGDVLTFRIDWKNYKNADAAVVVTDQLDVGLTFDPDTDLANAKAYIFGADGTPGLITDVKDKDGNAINPIATYNAENRTITWNLGQQLAGAAGYVEFKATVNENAKVAWDYEKFESGQEPDPNDVDYRIYNKGTVTVDNEPHVTNEVENPLPEKTETDPGDGQSVIIGQQIDYEIEWFNDAVEKNPDGTDKLDENGSTIPAKADVTVIDPLDDGVDFVSASFGGVELEAQIDEDGNILDGTAKSETTNSEGEPLVTITYDAGDHTVTWKLLERPAFGEPGSTGKVKLSVKVNENAVQYWNDYDQAAGEQPDDYLVRDRAQVEVKNGSTVFTNTVENPLDEKTETDPGDGETVGVGKQISYNIHWANDSVEKKPDGSTVPAAGTVTVTDKLDPGVDFLSASFGAIVLTKDTEGGKVTGEDGKVTITYDAATHTVIWTLADRPAQAQGDVALQVVVNEKAVKTWEYDPDDYADSDNTLGETNDDLVRNKAHIHVDNGADVDTSEMKNPLYEPEKTEPTPGDGKQVGVGDSITYKVTWKNYKTQPAVVTVTDKLDPGVTYTDGTAKAYLVAADGTETQLPDGAYNADARALTWELGERQPGDEGYVTFDVTVNADAVKTWDYSEGATGTNDFGEGSDHEVVNQARVTVDNESSVTNKVENPVPEKTETTPGAGSGVKVGENVSYEIAWKNAARDETTGEPKAATVTVTDVLDPGVDFVSAGFGGVTLSKDTAGGTATGEEGKVIITYDAGKHTVTWTLQERPAYGEEGSEGTVTLTVQVNEDAIVTWDYNDDATGGTGDDTQTDDVIHNQARVQVDNSATYTSKVDNPLWEPEKTETTPGAGELVQIGQQIDYEVTWKNYHGEPATVVVTDVLDTGVDFMDGTAKAYYTDGTEVQGALISYDSETRTITWDLGVQDKNAAGKVTFSVTVNASAKDYWNGYESSANPPDEDHQVLNQAQVKVGTDPAIKTDIIPNPVPEKTESDPGAGEVVGIGETVDYEVYWANGKDQPAKVVITDKLDPGVDFVSASFGGLTYNADGSTTGAEANVTISYDGADHTVTWDLGQRDVGANGWVYLTVEVNDLADRQWSYDDPSADVGEGNDNIIHNRARVTVDNSSAYTNIVDNPTKSPVSVTLRGLKTFEGGTLAAEQFRFTLTPYASNPKSDPIREPIQKSNDEGGTMTFFENVEYGDEGIYRYFLLEEIPGGAGHIIYDTHLWSVTVQVSQNAEGRLQAEIKLDDGQTVETVGPDAVVEAVVPFKNAYSPNVNVVIEGIKELEGGYLEDGQFSFVLSAIGGMTREPAEGEPSGISGAAAVQPVETVTGGVGAENNTETSAGDTQNTQTDAVDGTEGQTTAPAEGEEAAPAALTEESGNAPIALASESAPLVPVALAPEPEDSGVQTVALAADMPMVISAEVPEDETQGTEGEVADTPADTPADPPADTPTDPPADTPTDPPVTQPTDTPVDTPTEDPAPSDPPTDTPVDTPTESPAPSDAPTDTPTESPAPTDDPNATPAPDATDDPNATPGPEVTEEPEPASLISLPAGWVDLSDRRDLQPMPGRTFADTASPMTVTNVNNTYRFAPIEFTEEGEYWYELREQAPGIPGSTLYDMTVYRIKVTVKRAEPVPPETEGELQATVEYFRVTDSEGNSEPVESLGFKNAEVHKTETDPGDGETVLVGQTITYAITWINDEFAPATVTVRDPLDVGVDFAEASDGGVYDPASHAVYWTFLDVPARTSGTVTLKVKVNEKAIIKGQVDNQAHVKVNDRPEWDTEIVTNDVKTGRLSIHKTVTGEGDKSRAYTFTVTFTTSDGTPVEGAFAYTSNIGAGGSISSGGTLQLRDTERVIIRELPAGTHYTVTESTPEGYTVTYTGETGTIEPERMAQAEFVNEFYTHTPPPEGGPHKTETDPGDKEPVNVGQTITYEISWTNYRDTAATVTIRDPLDVGVDFVEASDGGTYTAEDHTVRWDLGQKAAGTTGKVTLKVKVNEKAQTALIVKNQAFVKVNGDPEQATEIPENPLPTPTPTPGGGPSPTPSQPIAPETGDSARSGLWLALLALSLGGLAGTVLALRRRKRRE